ncbi:MAG: transporter substrate-binding domain-containing protein [Ruminococcaceae bacterium]|nr:transporter substrate-binding domain-containing protein [Oscillospiraceae bacterium]
MKKILAIMLVLMLAVAMFAACEKQQDAAKDSANIEKDGKIVVGITEYAPMDYKDDNGEWTGFDAEFTREFAKSLDVEVEFVVIDWESKFDELNAGSIDCIWNGMTITDEVKEKTNCSVPYAKNKQVLVMKADVVANYQDEASLKNLSVAVEQGSAGEGVANDLGLTNIVPVTAQTDALLEVKAGTSQACIIDMTMAQAMTGEGTDYADLAMGILLKDEEYGIAFRKGSDMTEKINAFIEESKANGFLAGLSEKYGVEITE